MKDLLVKLEAFLMSLNSINEPQCHIIDGKDFAITDPKQPFATEITRSGISEFEKCDVWMTGGQNDPAGFNVRGLYEPTEDQPAEIC